MTYFSQTPVRPEVSHSSGRSKTTKEPALRPFAAVCMTPKRLSCPKENPSRSESPKNATVVSNWGLRGPLTSEFSGARRACAGTNGQASQLMLPSLAWHGGNRHAHESLSYMHGEVMGGVCPQPNKLEMTYEPCASDLRACSRCLDGRACSTATASSHSGGLIGAKGYGAHQPNDKAASGRTTVWR